MAYWLFKSEPDCYSIDDLQRDKQTVWDGVSNNLALKYLRTIKKGDLAIIYHTGDEKQAVGIAEVVSNPYVDPKLNDPKLVVVDVKFKSKLSKAVTLAEVKANKKLADFVLVKNARLSVMPVSEQEWEILLSAEKMRA